MISLALTLVLTQQDVLADSRLDAPVTVRVDCAPMPRLLDQLGKISPIKLAAHPGVANQVVVIDVHSQTWRDVLRRLALVTDNEWVKSSDTWTLTPSKTLRDAAEAEARSEVKKQVRKVLDEYLQIAEASYQPKDIAEAIITRARRESNSPGELVGPKSQQDSYAPIGRTLARALEQVDLDDIARLGADQRIVYSTQSTKLQRRLRMDKLNVTKKADEDAYEQALTLVRKIWTDIEQTSRIEFSSVQEVKRINLVIARDEQGFGMDAITATLTEFGELGAMSTSACLWMDLEGVRLLSGFSGEAAEIPFEVRGDTALHTKVLSEMGQVEPGAVDKRFKTLVENPDQYDPVSFLPNDYLVAYAETKKSNLIAEVPDIAIALGLPRDLGDPWLALEKQYLPMLFKQLDEGSEWLLLQPLNRGSNRLNRVDRTALGQFVRSKNISSLDVAGTYAARRGTSSQTNVAELVTLFSTADKQGFMGMPQFYSVDDTLLGFWGLLDTAQRSKLLGGATLPYASLSEPQKSRFQQIVFGTKGIGTLNFNSFGDPRLPEPDFTSREITDLLPNGLTNDARVTVATVRLSSLYQPIENSERWQPLDLNSLAYSLAAKIKPSVWEEGAKQPLPSRLRLGVDTKYAVKFWISPKDYMGFEYTESQMIDGGRDYTVEQLPLEVRRQLQSLVDSILKAGGGRL